MHTTVSIDIALKSLVVKVCITLACSLRKLLMGITHSSQSLIVVLPACFVAYGR